MRKVKISSDFTETPGARHREDGPFSGEEFREEILVPALEGDDTVEIDLDDTEGYGPSFLEEAFAGLVRVHEFAADALMQRLHFVSEDKVYIDQIKRYIQEQAANSV